MAMQLLGIGKASLHRFFAALIHAFATGGEAVLIDTLDTVLPDMPVITLVMLRLVVQVLNKRHWLHCVGSE